MDTLITYDEAVALVANPPTLAPRPNFTNLRALRRHLQRALQRLVNPQTNVLGWSVVAPLIGSHAIYMFLLLTYAFSHSHETLTLPLLLP